MIINDNSVEQINVALLDIDKKLKTTSVTSSQMEQIQKQLDNVQRTLRETSIGLSSGATYNINITGNASSASFATEAGSAKVTATAQSAEVANHANTADSATTANHAETATNATNANHAGTATNANHANTADSATTATSATTAQSATTAETATNANHAETAETATTAGTADKAINGTFGVLGGATMAVSENFNDLLNNELCNNINGGLMGGSIQTTTSSLGLGAGWWNFLYIPHRTGLGGDNTSFGTLLVTPMVENNGVLYIIHRISNKNFNAHKFQSVT